MLIHKEQYANQLEWIDLGREELAIIAYQLGEMAKHYDTKGIDNRCNLINATIKEITNLLDENKDCFDFQVDRITYQVLSNLGIRLWGETL